MESVYAKWGIGDLEKYKILSLARLPSMPISPNPRFESCTPSPILTPELINLFLGSRRQGLSKLTRGFYYSCLSKAIGMELSAKGINEFLTGLPCKNGKHSYFRTLRVLCNWMVRNGIMKENPIMNVDPPKVHRRILPSLSNVELTRLLSQANNPTHTAIISLLADSGMRLSEVTNVKVGDIDWATNTISIWGKGSKQRKAPFTESTGRLLKDVPYSTAKNMWNMTRRGIQSMLKDYHEKLGLPCNAHTFRRTFASNLHRKGVDVEHIMRLGGWETLEMVVRYTKSVKFEDSLRVYEGAMKG
jgi:site-specific recombinase XerD